MDPSEFLRALPPFDQLSKAAFRQVEATVEVAYAPRGQVVLRRSDPENLHLFVIRSGAVSLEAGGRMLEMLEEGELFGFPSLLAGSSPHVDVVAREDCLLYRIPKATFELAMEEREFARYFREGLQERLRQAVEVEPALVAADLTAPAGVLLTGDPVVVTPETTVAQAARLMSERGVSSVLVETDPPGIVTDRDLRNRVLAERRSHETAVREVMTSPLVTLSADAPLVELLSVMLESRVHHLPLVRDGEIVGVLTDTDLLRHHLKSPFHLLKQVERVRDPKVLRGYSDRLAGVVEAMAWGGVDAVQVGRLVATLNDTLLVRLLEEAEGSLGPPPCAYAFFVFGSEGRREQALATDQDNALAYAEPGEEAAAYFARMAEQVVDGLQSAGFPRCAGGFMATNWCRPLGEWAELFAGWVERPEPQALVEAANFFDFRRVHGDLKLEPLHQRLQAARANRVFIAHLARNAMAFHPPMGLFRTIKEEEGGVDVKKGGLMPIIGIGRVLALEAGVRERSTLRRLNAGAESGSLSRDGADLLADSFRFLLRLRLEHQLQARRAGLEVGNRIPLERLKPTERRHLKESFRVIRRHQEALAQRLDVDLLG